MDLATITTVRDRLFEIGQPRVVAVSIGYTPASLGVLIGAWLAGATVSMLSKRATAAEFATQLAYVKPNAIIVDDGDYRVEDAEPLIGQHVVARSHSDGHSQLSTRDALIAFTSGSTGEPKGAVLGANAVWANACAVCRHLNLGGDDVVTVFTPAHFTYALVQQLSAVVGGALIHLWPHGLASAHALRTFVHEVGATGVSANPTSFELLLDGSDQPVERLRYVLSAGQPLTGRLAAVIRRWAPRSILLSGYGCTENVNRVSFHEVPDDIPVDATASVGRPIPGTDISLAASGEVVLAGQSLMRGYLHAMRDAASAIQAFATGDLATIDQAGDLRLTGRLRTRINTSNEMVDPEEVEAALGGVDGVLDCAVGGIPDAVLGEAVAALCVAPTFEGREDELLRYLRSSLRSTLQSIKWPRHVAVVHAGGIPRTEYGKIDRRALSAALARLLG